MLTRRCYAAFWAWFFAAISIFQANSLFSQSKTLDREFDHVIVPGSVFSDLLGAPIDSLFLFSFDASSSSWEMIPFQIDEKDTSDNFVFPDSTDEIAGFDANDEIVFMADRAGDQASIWLDNTNSQSYARYEIAIVDTLDLINVKQGWVYLYRSSSLSKSFTEDHVKYVGSSNPQSGDDSVEGESYKIGGSASNGLFGFLSFPQNPSINVLDRQKIRGKTSFILLATFSEDAFGFKGILAKDGPVRVIRQLTISLLDQLDAAIPTQFFRNTALLGGNLNIPETIEFLGTVIRITEVRHSIDLSTQAIGMKFSNPNNSDVLINGMPDIVNDNIVVSPSVNYTHIGGNGRTIITLFSIPPTIGDARKLFYQDENGINDPGDGNSIGDSGIIISGQDIEGEFPLALKFVLFNSDQPTSLASQLAELEENPLQIEVTSQDFNTVSVELTSFNLAVERNNVLLNWVTGRESNNRGFEIQRRIYGVSTWQSIAFVEGSGTSNGLNAYTFIDRNVSPGSYQYRLKILDLSGSFKYSGTAQATVGLPETFALLQNFPNPFNPTTEIQYQLPAVAGTGSAKSRTVLKVYNLLGEEVRTLVDKIEAPGFYSVTWDGKDIPGRTAPSGIYIYRLQFGPFVETRKMVFVQ